MRIYSHGESIVLMGSVPCLTAVRTAVANFLASKEQSIRIGAEISADPNTREEMYRAIEFVKGNGPILVEISEDKTLRITGSVENLGTFSSFFHFPPGAHSGNHHHPEYVAQNDYIAKQSIPVVIEVE